MKKLVVGLLLVLTLSVLMLLPAFADAAPSAEVYVTISDGQGKLVLVQEKIIVADQDGDGVLTIHDALYAAHEAKYNGGAEAGYLAESSAWGLSLMKLWGEENGGSYGYFVNDASPAGMTAPVKNGDYVNAYVYTDLTAWSDTYSYFDVKNVQATVGDEVTLTLLAVGFDESFAPINLPVEGATVTVNGVATSYRTDAEGKVTVKLETAGDLVISAKSEAQTLVPPVCVATVSAPATEAPVTDPSAPAEKEGCGSVISGATSILLCIGGAVLLSRRRRDEK